MDYRKAKLIKHPSLQETPCVQRKNYVFLNIGHTRKLLELFPSTVYSIRFFLRPFCHLLKVLVEMLCEQAGSQRAYLEIHHSTLLCALLTGNIGIQAEVRPL